MTAEARVTRRPSTAWIVSWVAYATYYLGRKGFSVAKKPIEAQLGISRGALAAIDTGHLAAYSVGMFANGMLADRVGARRMVGFGMLASAIACVAFGVSSSAIAFGVAFFVNGFAQSTGWPGTTRAMAEWTTSENRRQVMAWWCTCYQFGGIVATALAAWLLNFGWRSAFFGPAVVLAMVAVGVFSLLTPGPHAPDLRSEHSRTPAEVEARRVAVRAALRSPVLYAFGASYFAIKLIRYSLLFWLPYYLSDELHYAPKLAGYVSTGFEVGGTVGVVGMGLLTHRLRHLSRPLLASGTLVGLALSLVLYQQVGALGPWANALSLCVVGACLFGPDSIISGAAAQDAGGPHAAATATGMVNGIGSVGAILQGALNAWVSSAFGWRAVFFVLIGFAFVAALALVPAFRGETAPGTSLA